jgi:uncharacterized protein (UPF0276 family)
MTTNTNKPFLGFGLGLRTDHYEEILEQKPKNIDWFEIISENYMEAGGKPLYYLDKIRADYPMVMHGVSMSIGSSDPLNFDYLKKLKKLADRIEPTWFSDHLCWTGVDHKNVPVDRVWQHHLAGHQNNGNIIIDTHDQPIIDKVWDLYEQASKYLGPVSTMIERDDNIPPLAEVIEELDRARTIASPHYMDKSNVG